MEEVLSQIWDALGDIFGGISRAVERSLTSLFGSSNARYIKKMQPTVDAIGALEPKYQAMTDAELKEQTAKFRKRLAGGETLDDLLVEAFAVCREAGRRNLGMRHFDVQLMGGMVLHRGNIAEMVTGEGKTLVATLAAYLNALEGKGVHVVTVNDYLARRDMEWMGPLYMSLGLTVNAIQSQMEAAERQKAYACDITYGTNNEFGFDYLRDNMRNAARDDDRFDKHLQQVQGALNFAIVDEVDNILIDEARTPLIISGPAHDDVTRYAKADRIARQLKKVAHFEVNEKEHTAHLTDDGVRAAEQLAGVESFYTAGNMEWPHLIDNSLKAHHLYKRDVNYIVSKEGEVVIVDEFTGRLMPGRNWSDGLHQAVEAKEGVRIKEEYQTLATITLQNFFKLYKRICGMTGTAMTEANEFWKVYKLDVIAMPTNRKMKRLNHPDVIYRSEEEKYNAIADEIERMNKWDIIVPEKGDELLGKILGEADDAIEFQDHETRQKQTLRRTQTRSIERAGRPILVGTVSIERSEMISRMLEQRGVKHEVLNAKHHQREAEIIAQAGRKGAVTIATNMAGRGTDIILGGNPEAMAWAQLQTKYLTKLDVPPEEMDALVHEIEQREQMKAEGREVAALGGLHVLGSERHEARRIDLQLRGRCGRQGDSGSSRFYLSLEDDLMRKFGGEWVKNWLTRLGMQDGEAIESRMVSRRIEGAQKKVEERNFEVRKNLLEYDEVMDEQRKRIYGYRQRILEGGNGKQLMLDMIRQQVNGRLNQFLARDYGTETFATWAGKEFSVEFDARDFRGLDFQDAQRYALAQAERKAEGHIMDALEENVPTDAEDQSDWNWEALAKFANTRWHIGIRDRELKQVGREQLDTFLLEKATAAIAKVDLAAGREFLEADYGIRAACAWVKNKFGIELSVDSVRDLPLEEFKKLVYEKAEAAYREKEIEYPVMAGLSHFTNRDAGGHKRYDREGLVEWARKRFDVHLDLEDLKNRQRDEIRALLIEHSRRFAEKSVDPQGEVATRLKQVFDDQTLSSKVLHAALEDGRLKSLSDWLSQDLNYPLSPEAMTRLNPEVLKNFMASAVEAKYRPEMQKLERALLLNLLDSAWKDHLLVMDHLRNSVGLRGYAQVDPKVEYKREGMKTFEQMWDTVGERTTDLIFRMEQLDESFVGSTWTGAEARHDAPPPSDIGDEQQSAIEGTQNDGKPKPIRNRDQRVGRNDPCPCGSGKKFKNCHMRKS
ncbi:MAG: SEC-C metal-binding domain-containing protein [Planctomycetota bacterium]